MLSLRLLVLAGAALAVATTAAGCSRPPVVPPTSPSPASPAQAPTPVPARPLDLYVGARPAVVAVGSVVERDLATPDGRTRHYRLFVPAGLTGSTPLLVALHGGLGSGAQFEKASGFDGLATSNGFLVAYPDGLGAGPDGGTARTWNAQGCCGRAAAAQVDDVAFVRAVVTDVEASHPVDRARVFAAGHSNGAMLSLRLACEASDVFAAAGVQSGALVSSPCDPARPVSLLQIHGTADRNVPIDGGVGDVSISRVDYPPARRAATTIAGADGCSTSPTTVIDAHDTDIAVTTYPGCRSGSSVEFVAVTGAAHAWMGGPDAPVVDRVIGTPYPGLDSSRAIWSFLTTHPRT